ILSNTNPVLELLGGHRAVLTFPPRTPYRPLNMNRRRLANLTAVFSLCTACAAAAVPNPEQYFGFRIGSDRKLVRYDKIIEYMQKVAAESDRVRYHNLGPTTNGNPFALLEISSAENLKKLDHL